MPVFSGAKWGANARGSTGGVVTWSLIGPGAVGVIDAYDTEGFRAAEDLTADGQIVTGFNVIAALKSAFTSWSDVADIEFVQVADGGERVIGGFSADFRIAFGFIDGTGNSGLQLGAAYFPARNETARAGDILFDEDEFGAASSRKTFVSVAAHEIGHSIGLRHVNNEAALLNPIIGRHSTPQADDIDGARQIYGAPRDTKKRLLLDDNTPDIRIAERKEGLSILVTSDENRITGAAGGEEMRGLGGDDRLIGGGGADSLFGGGGDDFQKGGGGLDRLLGNAGEDTLIGGGRADFLKGGGGADELKGGGGADELTGNGRNDRLDGGRGDDTLKGGGGADVFVLTGGRDLALDFNAATDRIDASAFGGLADLTITDTEQGAEVSGGPRTLVLRGVGAEDLGEDQFIFAGGLTEASAEPPVIEPAPEAEPEPVADPDPEPPVVGLAPPDLTDADQIFA